MYCIYMMEVIVLGMFLYGVLVVDLVVVLFMVFYLESYVFVGKFKIFI